jgi:hypothetical protein
MKTTIELPDELFAQAKRATLERGTTLKALIEQGLRHALAQPRSRSNTRFRFPVIASMTAREADAMSVNEVIDSLRISEPGPPGRG